VIHCDRSVAGYMDFLSLGYGAETIYANHWPTLMDKLLPCRNNHGNFSPAIQRDHWL